MVYGSEILSLCAQERRKIEVFKMMCLRNICGIRRINRVRNSLIREQSESELSVLEKQERNAYIKSGRED